MNVRSSQTMCHIYECVRIIVSFCWANVHYKWNKQRHGQKSQQSFLRIEGILFSKGLPSLYLIKYSLSRHQVASCFRKSFCRKQRSCLECDFNHRRIWKPWDPQVFFFILYNIQKPFSQHRTPWWILQSPGWKPLFRFEHQAVTLSLEPSLIVAELSQWLHQNFAYWCSQVRNQSLAGLVGSTDELKLSSLTS